ncbi:acidic phospholipase A2 PA4 [Drosophila grimshawi]|uniref:phospholipase A2 n=1 Tax=Drosophila grimshawi TaxID=7222 RepID=B4JNP7_DROGR|nr:acidic phospholipase A2 PA4 [Drosophila grimshawi]EDV92340.1 GH24101 [Drosophila grimshawi]
MALMFNCNCNYIYLLICLLTVFAWQLCAARQMPLPANVAAVASAAPTTTTAATRAQQQQQQQQQQQRYHASYDNHDNDDDDMNSDASLPSVRRRRQVSDWFIAPNTRWCGRGNTANGTYNALGGASMADKCCRTHDHCKFYIAAMSNQYELFNYRPYTLSHCSCDRRFRTCLKMARDEDAITIGKLFFNVVQTQCFVLKTESICQQRGESNNCLKTIERRKAYLRENKKF